LNQAPKRFYRVVPRFEHILFYWKTNSWEVITQFIMNTNATPRIVATEKMGDVVFIEFDDGKSGLFSAPLLHQLLPQAVAVDSPDGIDGAEEDE
jgi:hypothetical protein